MKNLRKLCKGLSRTGPAMLLASFMLIMVVSAATATAATEAPQLMFVQTADNVSVDTAAKTLRLVNVNQQTLYFSDRPVRIAGHIKMADYLEEWTAKAGKDNFGADPPNAASRSMSRANPTTRWSSSRSPIPASTAPISSTATSSSTATFPPAAARPRCLSTGSGSAAASGAAFMASASVDADPGYAGGSGTSSWFQSNTSRED